MTDTIPIVNSLDKIYQGAEAILKQGVRWDSLRERFREQYGINPEFIARAPGRVNLIGEHIDYAYFGVLPMAIERDVLIAVATDDSGKVKVTNIDSKYSSRNFTYTGPESVIEIDDKVFEWTNYFKSGYKGILNSLKPALGQAKGMKVMVDGIIPTGSGVSSSSAIVVCSALATYVSNEPTLSKISKRQFTELVINSERFIGTNSGGMDQTASVYSTFGNALFISFYPELRAFPLTLPNTSIAFVVANSLVVSNKHVIASKNYNLRAVECNLAAHILSNYLGLKNDLSTWLTLRQVMDQYFAQKTKQPGSVSDETNSAEMEERLTEMLKIIKDAFEYKDIGYNRDSIVKILGNTRSQLENAFFTQFPIHGDIFQLYKRSNHVYSEALRVQKFRRICFNETNQSSEQIFMDLGRLMNESQDSCRDIYDCSCPELDELVHIARTSGAFGSRLTGAGWGGCTVSLVHADSVPEFINSLKVKYYAIKFPHLGPEQLDEAIFATRPGSGAVVYKVDS